LNDQISDKDKKDWQTFVTGKDKVHNKDFRPQTENILRSKSIDLHGYTLEQANKAVEKFILEAFGNKISKLIVISIFK